MGALFFTLRNSYSTIQVLRTELFRKELVLASLNGKVQGGKTEWF